MKHGAEWYKREPLAYLGGVQGMTAKEHAVYAVVLDLIYAHGGAINNDPRWIAGWISDMGPAAIRSTISALAERGKLTVTETEISQKRAVNEVQTRENLRETRQKLGKKGGENSAKSRAEHNENNDIGEAKASTDVEAIREEKRREEKKEEQDACANPANSEPETDPTSWTPDRLWDAVIQAVGLKSGRIPTHWLPPAATTHAWRWVTDLKLTPEAIVDAARTSRQHHPEPPNGPKALDGVMSRLAAAIQAPMAAAAVPAAQAPKGRLWNFDDLDKFNDDGSIRQ